MSDHDPMMARCAGCGVRRADDPAHHPGSAACKAARLQRKRRARKMRDCYSSYGDPKLRHDEESAASAIAAAATRGVTLRPYRCRWCDHLHVGRAPGQ